MNFSADLKDRDGETLKYNQSFNLQCIGTEAKPLVLYSTPKTMALQNITKCPYKYFKNGEVNQAVGVCLRQVGLLRFKNFI